MKTSIIRKLFIIVSITTIITGLCFVITGIIVGVFPKWGIIIILGGVVIGIIGMLINTDIKALKVSYFANNGSTFHMSREDPDEYSLYDNTMPIIFGWDRQLLKSKFATFWDDPENVWLKVDEIIEILDRKRVGIRRWASRLLDELEKSDSLDTHNKILIIESMCGRNALMDEGGVHLICKHTNLEQRMDEVMNKLMDFSCDGSEEQSERYFKSVEKYKEAYEKFKRKR